MPSTEASRLTAALRTRVRDFLRRHNLSETRNVLLVGVSGGPDSVALLHILTSLRAELRLRLRAAHLNHRLRGGESDADAAYVRSLCRKLNVPVTIESADVESYRRRARLSLEEAGRHVRYGFFATVGKKASAQAVLLGHTADDQAETVLMHILRGSGLGGLRGMEAVSDWRGAKGARLAIGRPFLHVRRRETHAYCKAHALSPRRDSSNKSLAFFRNRLRLELLPSLRAYNPRIVEALVRMAESAGQASDYLEGQVTLVWEKLARPAKEGLSLDRAAFVKLAPALQVIALQRALAHVRGDVQGIEWEHLAKMQELASGPAGRSLSLPGGLRFEADYHRLLLRLSAAPAVGALGETPLIVPGVTAFGPWKVNSKLAKMPKSAPFAANVLWLEEAWAKKGLTLRGRRPGDRFTPSGMGVPKKLQDYMVDAKIPRAERDSLPLLCAGGDILWVAGHRASALSTHPATGKRALRIAAIPM